MTFNIWIQDRLKFDSNTQIRAETLEEATEIAEKMTKFRGWTILDIRPVV